MITVDNWTKKCPRCGDGEGYIVRKYGKLGKKIGICVPCELRNIWKVEEQ